MTDITTERRECATHGAYDAKVFRPAYPGSDPIVFGCPKCAEKRQTEEETRVQREAARQRTNTITNLKRDCGIPFRFADTGFTIVGGETAEMRSAIATARKFADEFPDMEAEGKSLVFIGPPGTGKTHTAAAIGRTVIEKHLASVLYTTAADMARAMRATFRRDSEISEREIFERFTEADLLIVDEVGTGSSQHDRSLLFEVIDVRYAQGMPMVLVSNLPVGELEQYLGERAFDRLAEASVFLPMTGTSKRKRRGLRETITN